MIDSWDGNKNDVFQLVTGPHVVHGLVNIKTDDPQDTDSRFGEHWAPIWRVGDMAARTAVVEVAQKLRSELLPLKLSPILSGTSLRRSTSTLREGTTVGSDSVGVDWIADLPDVILNSVSGATMLWVTTLVTSCRLFLQRRWANVFVCAQ